LRKIRHLASSEFVIPVNRAAPGLVALSNQYNCYVERVWDQSDEQVISVDIHARFNTSTMNGIEIQASLFKNKIITSNLVSAKLYVLSDSGFTKTFITDVTMSEVSTGIFTGTVNQATLALNELSGRETYFIECKFSRIRKKYSKGVYFNHLGVYDSVNRLRHEVEFLQIAKVDE
jgi:hypothetical protein